MADPLETTGREFFEMLGKYDVGRFTPAGVEAERHNADGYWWLKWDDAYRVFVAEIAAAREAGYMDGYRQGLHEADYDAAVAAAREAGDEKYRTLQAAIEAECDVADQNGASLHYGHVDTDFLRAINPDGSQALAAVKAEAARTALEWAASFGTMPGKTWHETLRYHAEQMPVSLTRAIRSGSDLDGQTEQEKLCVHCLSPHLRRTIPTLTGRGVWVCVNCKRLTPEPLPGAHVPYCNDRCVGDSHYLRAVSDDSL